MEEKVIRPYVFISNDDGVDAPGLQFLIEVLKPHADLLVMAPDGPRSGFSSSITSTKPLTYRTVHEEEGLRIYACSGTPVDCVKMMINLFAPEREPDLIFSGINHGDNSSVNAHYSGTLGAAFEGALQGYPSVAFSLCDLSRDADFEPLRPYLVNLLYKSITIALPPFTCLNVNFPKTKHLKGIKVCRMALSRWQKEVVKRKHPWGANYYWLVGENVDLEPKATDTDHWALAHGYVAVTPLRLDMTDYGLIDIYKDIID